MMPALDAAEAATRIGRALEAAGIDHAIGGALALGVHGVPRGTLDVDLNVFVSEERLGAVFDVLCGVGVTVDKVSAPAPKTSSTSSASSQCKAPRSIEPTCGGGSPT